MPYGPNVVALMIFLRSAVYNNDEHQLIGHYIVCIGMFMQMS